jgi:hypothetical protein
MQVSEGVHVMQLSDFTYDLPNVQLFLCVKWTDFGEN